MQIQVNTDRNIKGREALAAWVGNTVQAALSHYSDHITRVEVHLSDENGSSKAGGDDMRCMMEARLEGRNPVAVTHHAASMGQAVNGAADKLGRMIGSDIQRLRDRHGRSGAEGPPA